MKHFFKKFYSVPFYLSPLQTATGILGSNADADGRFRFKPWTGSWR